MKSGEPGTVQNDHAADAFGVMDPTCQYIWGTFSYGLAGSVKDFLYLGIATWGRSPSCIAVLLKDESCICLPLEDSGAMRPRGQAYFRVVSRAEQHHPSAGPHHLKHYTFLRGTLRTETHCDSSDLFAHHPMKLV
eukprot:5323368-Amphidinium_carterae.2